MAKRAKRKVKLKTKLTSIARLFRYQHPICMVGDPPEANTRDWGRRSHALYQNWVMNKQNPRQWTEDQYINAHMDNHRYDQIWIEANKTQYFNEGIVKIGKVSTADLDNWEFDWDEAQLDAHNFDYEREYIRPRELMEVA